MADLSEEIKDLKQSLAYNILDGLLSENSISKAEADLYKSKYAKLHEFVLTTYENEKTFLGRAKQLNHRLMSEKIKLEKTQLDQQEDQNVLAQLSDQLHEKKNDLDQASERDMMSQIQLAELEHEKREKQQQLKERDEERQAEAEPQLQAARDEVENLHKQIEHLKQQKLSYQTKIEEFTQRLQQVEDDTQANQEVHKGYEVEFKKIKDDPERIRKQAEKFENAVKSLTESFQERKTDIEANNEILKKKKALQKEREEQKSKALLRLQMITESVKITEQSCEDAQKRMAREKAIYVELVQKRVGLDSELDELNTKTRLAVAEHAHLQKMYEKLKRSCRKMQQNKEAVEESLGPLQANRKDLQKQTKQQEEELKRQKKLVEEMQAEVELFIFAHLKQESLEKEKKDELESINQQIEEMQKELKSLKSEEQQWTAEFKDLTSLREKLARDTSTAHRLCRETADEVAMKQLEEDDLKKKHQEINQKQKEFCTMYEVVKNERNKYMTHIQKSSQHLSEMKEKMKILQNEVEILRMESAFKDKQLQRTRQEAQRLENAKEALQTEKTRITAKGAHLNESVEQYVIEYDKLNSIINSIEKEMVILRRKYEQAVETRNFTGIQLIDRNDELCILWEKSNIQEKLLKKGEEAMMQKTEELRSLKIDLAEARRQLHVVQKRIPEVPKLIADVVRLREQVTSVQKRTDDLSLELENPQSSLRKWRKLGGGDLDPQTLRSKIQDLEERLNDKKESLLEKELILEEVTALSEKLRQQAVDGRQGTMELSQKVNVFQARIKDVTRKMMATVSELSMYQATAHKLESERDNIFEMSVEARERLKSGEPPTENIIEEFNRMLQQDQLREETRQQAAQRQQEEEILNSNFTRTTAEPRVNAYIPENEHGLPKAYGANAPFKPSAGGSTMRHIRKPNPKPLEA